MMHLIKIKKKVKCWTFHGLGIVTVIVFMDLVYPKMKIMLLFTHPHVIFQRIHVSAC